MKWLFGFLSLIFVLFALVQLNDPDPVLWVTYYLIMSLVMAAVGLGKSRKIHVYIMSVITVIGMIYYFSGVYDWLVTYNAENIVQSMKAEKPHIEETREFFGLAICLASLVLAYFKRSQ